MTGRERGTGAGDDAQSPAAAVHGQRALRTGVAWVPVERDVIAVRGADAVSFLQGQLSADVAALGTGDQAWSLLLEPQGKVDAWFRIWRTAEAELLIDVDGGWAEPVVERLGRFKLRVEAEIEPLPGWSCVALRGPDSESVELADCGAELTASVDWRGLAGVDLLGPAVSGPRGVPQADRADLEVVRIEQGWPRMGRELDSSVIPAELGAWFVDASVSFTKGCYTGQELVARIDSRGGNTPRRLRGLVLDPQESGEGAAVPPVGAEVHVAGQSRGTVTSAGWSESIGAPVALAFLHRSVEVSGASQTRVSVLCDGTAVPARAVELPIPVP